MKEFFFIRVPRTASNSIARALGDRSNETHRTALQCKNILGEKRWQELYTFAFVRNPWDRAVSWYKFCRGMGQLTQRQREYYRLPFKEWVLNGMRTHWEITNNNFGGTHPLLLHEYLLDRQGKTLVNFVGRFEDLPKAYLSLCTQLGITRVPKLSFVYRTRNKDYDYKRYYDSTTKEIISKKFKKDIALFNYKF